MMTTMAALLFLATHRVEGEAGTLSLSCHIRFYNMSVLIGESFGAHATKLNHGRMSGPLT
jgi:hypothetical protein